MLTAIRVFTSRLFGLFRGRSFDRGIDEEFQSHLEMLVDRFTSQGMTRDQAQYAAKRQFGGAAQIKEQLRERHGSALLDSSWGDMRYALRQMRGSPVFAATAIFTLALGIGANTAIFSIIDAVMMHSLAVQEPQQLVVASWSANRLPSHLNGLTSSGDTPDSLGEVNPTGSALPRPFFQEIQSSGLFTDVAGFSPAGPLALSGNGPASSVEGETVTGSFFNMLGIRPAAGRLLGPADDNPSAPPALVLSYEYWQKTFGGSTLAVGKVVKLNDIPFTIVGVAEPRFRSLTFGNVYDLWIPMSFWPVTGPSHMRMRRAYDDPLSWWMLIIAKLKPDLPATRAQAATDAMFRNFTEHAGGQPIFESGDNPRLILVPAKKALVGHIRHYADPIWVMMAAVGIVLLIACANVAGLMLARTAARRREIAVRLALGARRTRLLRQLLTESVLMAMLGGGLGVLIAIWGSQVIVTMIGSTAARPLGLSASLDWRVLGFAAAISAITGLLFGLAPALRSLRLDLTPVLKSGTQASTGKTDPRHRWLSMGNGLVAAQAALAVVVLMGAGLLVHTLTNLKSINPGFDTRNLLTFELNPSLAGYKGVESDAFYRELQARISSLPGVISASYSADALLAGSWSRTDFRYVPPGGSKKVVEVADIMPVSPQFFKTLKIPLLAGRNFTVTDYDTAATNRAAQIAQDQRKPGEPERPVPTTPESALVNRQFVKKFLAGVNPIGQRFGAEDGSDPDRSKGPGYEVIGMVGDAKYSTLQRDIDATIYVPITGSGATFEVRTAGDPKSLIAPIRSLVNQLHDDLPMTNVETQTEHIDQLLAQERIMAQVSTFFGLLALVLACVGLYGLLSYEVARRTREIGIRMALGAERSDLVRMMVGQGIALVLAGATVGVVAALALARLLTKLLFGVKPSDPVTLVAVVLLLLIVALVAAFVPARRATTVDPMSALRYE